MPAAPLPVDELARLAELRKYEVLDTPPEKAFDDAVKLAAGICGTPMAVVSLVDESRQWFKARVGLAVEETPRELSFCAHAILHPQEMLVVSDATQDARFADNPQVTGPDEIRFYAGVPLVTAGGHALGTLCVIDTTPKEIPPAHCEALATLARTVVTQLELRRASSELARANDQLRDLSFIDPLTGLANRRALDVRLVGEMERAIRHDAPLVLLMLDIDYFKQYNDSCGHVLGDDALSRFAALLSAEVRQTDLVARYGGEEFAVLLPETTEEGARLLAERYRAHVAATSFPCRTVTTSIGLAAWQPRFERPEDFISAADQALYAAKAGGRNQVAVFREPDASH